MPSDSEDSEDEEENKAEEELAEEVPDLLDVEFEPGDEDEDEDEDEIVASGVNLVSVLSHSSPTLLIPRISGSCVDVRT